MPTAAWLNARMLTSRVDAEIGRSFDYATRSPHAVDGAGHLTPQQRTSRSFGRRSGLDGTTTRGRDHSMPIGASRLH